MGAGEFVAAGFAQSERRIAAAIEEQHRLFAGGQRLFQRLAQGRRQPLRLVFGIGRVRSCRRSISLTLRQYRHAMPRRELQMGVASALGIDEAFQRRRGAGQHHGAILDARAHHRHVARVIDGAVLLLESLLVFLIDDDKAQLRKGQEQR